MKIPHPPSRPHRRVRCLREAGRAVLQGGRRRLVHDRAVPVARDEGQWWSCNQGILTGYPSLDARQLRPQGHDGTSARSGAARIRCPKRPPTSCTCARSRGYARRRTAIPGQRLAHDPLGDERGDVGRADGGRDHLDDVHADDVEPRRELADGPEQVDGASSRPAPAFRCRARTPGRGRRRRPSGRPARRRPRAIVARRRSLIPRSRTSCMKKLVIPCSACQPNSFGPGQ